MANFNWVDYLVLGIVLFSMVIGLIRGFVKEILSLITWVVAFVVASLFATRLAAAFSSNQSGANDAITMGSGQSLSLISVAISYIVIFIAVLILGKILTYFISDIGGNGLGFVNRLLGAAFGFARGVLIIVVMMFLAQLTPLSQESYWLSSQYVNALAPTVKKIEEMVEPRILDLKNRMNNAVAGVNNLYDQGLGGFADMLTSKS